MPTYETQQSEVFESEWKVLSHAKKILDEGEFRNSEQLMSDFKFLVKQYEKLLKVNQKIFSISDLQGLALKRQENEIKNLLNHADQGFLTFGQDLLVRKHYSAECHRIFGKKIFRENIIDLLWSGQYRQDYADILQQLLAARDERARKQLIEKLPILIQLDGKDIHMEFKLIRVSESDDEVNVIMVILTDITEQLSSRAKVEYLSYHDSLTSLYNRAYVDKVMEGLISPAQLPLSMIIADMNGLKLTNDVFGHQKGDELLKKAALILKSRCRETDIIARWGGDEFLILAPRTTRESCEELIRHIHEACEEEETESVKISFAIGFSTMEQPTQTTDELFLEAEAKMYKEKLLEATTVRKRLIDSMLDTLRSSASEDKGHTDRVEAMAVRFAKIIGIHEQSMDMRNVRMLSALHDVGNIGVPKEILQKSGELTGKEWEKVKNHSEIGYRVAHSLGENVLAEAILYMHERWDGAGYPCGLSGEQIPLLVRLLSIVDVFDVIIHDRVYREGMNKQEAVEELRKQSGKQFDPNLVDIFCRDIDRIIESTDFSQQS